MRCFSLIVAICLVPAVVLAQCQGACQDTSVSCPGTYQPNLCPGPDNSTFSRALSRHRLDGVSRIFKSMLPRRHAELPWYWLHMFPRHLFGVASWFVC